MKIVDEYGNRNFIPCKRCGKLLPTKYIVDRKKYQCNCDYNYHRLVETFGEGVKG